MERIETEFGLNLQLYQKVTEFDKFCIKYAYTLDLCMQMQLRTAGMEKTLRHRGITDADLVLKIGDTVNCLLQKGYLRPHLAKEISDAFHLLKHSFPNCDLFAVTFNRSQIMTNLFFSTVPPGQPAEKSIPCPKWLSGAGRKEWILRKPKTVGVGIYRESHQGVIMLYDYNPWQRMYSHTDIER